MLLLRAGGGQNKQEENDGNEQHRQEEVNERYVVVNQSTRRELIYISGESGTGKSALANTLQQPTTNAGGGVFCRGKYDLTLRDQQPFAAIAQACNELCDHVLSLRNGRNKSTLMFEQIQTGTDRSI